MTTATKTKVIFESTKQGWENFGTVNQNYVNPFTIVLGSTGKVYEVDKDGIRSIVKSNTEYYSTGREPHGCFTPKNMTEIEARKLYSEMVNYSDSYTYFE
jgi:hypothetical protein